MTGGDAEGRGGWELSLLPPRPQKEDKKVREAKRLSIRKLTAPN